MSICGAKGNPNRVERCGNSFQIFFCHRRPSLAAGNHARLWNLLARSLLKNVTIVAEPADSFGLETRCYNGGVLLRCDPMRLVRRPRPFDHPDWIFELKLDGFRALAHFENGKGELVSRNRNTFASFQSAGSRNCRSVQDRNRDPRRRNSLLGRERIPPV